MAQCVAVKIKTDQGLLVIASIFYPPNFQLTPTNSFLVGLDHILSLQETGMRIIISGVLATHVSYAGSCCRRAYALFIQRTRAIS